MTDRCPACERADCNCPVCYRSGMAQHRGFSTRCDHCRGILISRLQSENAELRREVDEAWRNDRPITNAEMIRQLESQLAFCREIEAAMGDALAPPETLEEAWDDGYKVGKFDGFCDAKSYARRIGDKNPHRAKKAGSP